MIRKPMEKGSLTMKSKPSVIHHNAPLVHSVPINLGPFHLFHLNFQEVPIFINEISFTTNILSLQEFGYFVVLFCAFRILETGFTSHSLQECSFEDKKILGIKTFQKIPVEIGWLIINETCTLGFCPL